jgi:putative DNA primase/helicase
MTGAVANLGTRLGLTKRPRSWSGACPACDYPRAFSLRPGKDGRVKVYCANGCTFDHLTEVLERVAGADWTPPKPLPDGQAEAARAGKQAAALRMWARSVPAPGTPADRYLSGRALPDLAGSAALRFLADCQHPEGGRLPALIALVADAAGQPIAVHRTFLARDGAGKAKVDPVRASLGAYWGGAVRLAPLDPALPLVVGEGIETAASAGRLIGAPAWTALSAGNLARGLVLPSEVRAVVVALDPDPPGERAAHDAAARWAAEGRTVQLARPAGPGDFNDTLAALALEGVAHA